MQINSFQIHNVFMNVGMSAEFQCSVQINSVQIHNGFMDKSGCLQTCMGFGVWVGRGGV